MNVGHKHCHFIMYYCLLFSVAAEAAYAKPWFRRRLGDFCERFIISTDFSEQLDFREASMSNDDLCDWLRREYVATGAILSFRFDREKRAYLRQLGAMIRRLKFENDETDRYKIYERSSL